MENVDKRSKDAYFDGIMNKTLSLHSKNHLIAAYGESFVCRDANCKVCNWYRDGEAVRCRTCHSLVRPRQPSQQEICQFHRDHSCSLLPSFDIHGKAPSKFVTKQAYNEAKERMTQFRSTSDYIVGYNDPVTAFDDDWGIKKCACLIHVYNWEVCSYCSPSDYKTSPYSVQWRHYLDLTSREKPQPLVFNKEYYARIYDIMCQANRQAFKAQPERIDYTDAEHPLFGGACALCDSIPLDDTVKSKYSRCSNCKVTRYCSLDCQKWHWKQHKNDCMKLSI